MVNFSLWVDAFLKPKETFQKEKANASIKEGALNILTASFIISVLLSIVVAILGSVGASFMGLSTVEGFGGGVVGLIIIIFILFVVGELVGSFISVGIIWLTALLLGGKGSFTQQYYLSSLFTAPLLVLLIINIIPLIGGLLTLIAALYSIYLLYLVVKEVHGLSTGKTVLSILLIPIILLILLVLVFGAILLK